MKFQDINEIWKFGFLKILEMSIILSNSLEVKTEFLKFKKYQSVFVTHPKLFGFSLSSQEIQQLGSKRFLK